jgi:hypothetical protein
MPSIVGKRRGNQTYYYLVESARVDGKPRIVSQQYLGSADEVMAKLSDQQAGAPVRSQHKGFGDLAAVWSVLERLRMVDIVDAVVPRRADALASVGTYLALAVANRVVAPCSKLAFADWWQRTAGPRWTQLPTEAVGPWHFWRAMDGISAEELREIEGEIFRRMVDEYDLDLSGLVLDMTNFATFIDSANDRASIAQRGKAKQKRVDLRLVGLMSLESWRRSRLPWRPENSTCARRRAVDCPLCDQPIVCDQEVGQGFCFRCNDWVTAYPDQPDPYLYTAKGRPYRPRKHGPDDPPGRHGGQPTPA